MCKLLTHKRMAQAVSRTKRSGTMLHIYRHQIPSTTVPSEVIAIPEIQYITIHEPVRVWSLYSEFTTVFHLQDNKHVGVDWTTGYDQVSWREETEDQILQMLDTLGLPLQTQLR